MTYFRDRFENKAYPLSTVLGRAGYRVPGVVYLREGRIAEAVEQFIEDGNEEMLALIRKTFEVKS